MRDVARLAGVSITTVSHVVNGTRTVGAETKARVLEAIAATGYTGNALARSLVTGGTGSLGVAISVVANPYFAELIRAIEGEAAQAGFTLLLADTHDKTETEQKVIRTLRSRRVDGLVLAPSALTVSTVLPELHQLKVPVVLVDRLTGGDQVDQVGVENVQATAAMVQHLAEHGHRRIGLVSGASGLATTTERVNGYRLGLARANLPWKPSLVISGESAARAASAALHRLMELPDAPTAVIAANNSMLVGVLHAVRERGLRIGTDLALIAYDDVEWADLVDPPITTMRQPIDEIGRTAVRMLVARITTPDRAPRTVRLPPRLMHRSSCGCS
jgi:LacI family transcriptional regulator